MVIIQEIGVCSMSYRPPAYGDFQNEIYFAG